MPTINVRQQILIKADIEPYGRRCEGYVTEDEACAHIFIAGEVAYSIVTPFGEGAEILERWHCQACHDRRWRAEKI